MSENTLISKLDPSRVSFCTRNEKSAVLVCDGIIYLVTTTDCKSGDLLKAILLRQPDIKLEVTQDGLESLLEDVDACLVT